MHDKGYYHALALAPHGPEIPLFPASQRAVSGLTAPDWTHRSKEKSTHEHQK